MPGTLCAVASCTNSMAKTRHLTGENSVSYYKIPKDKKLRSIWIERCKRKDPFNPETSRVCSDHFKKEDFIRDLKNELLCKPIRKLLKLGAVPSTLLLPSDEQQCFSVNKIDREERQKLKARKCLATELLEVQIVDEVPNVAPRTPTAGYEKIYQEPLRKHEETQQQLCGACDQREVAYKRKRLRNGAVPCYFPSDNNSYSRKRRKSDSQCDLTFRRILAETDGGNSKNMMCWNATDNFSGNVESYSSSLINNSDTNTSDSDEFSDVYSPCEDSMEQSCEIEEVIECEEVKYADILARVKLFDDIWSDSQILTLPSKSWAIFQLELREQRRMVVTQMGFSNTGVPVPMKQICLDQQMNVDLYLKNNKLNFDEMSIKPPRMLTVDDVSSFIKSVDGLQDWE